MCTIGDCYVATNLLEDDDQEASDRYLEEWEERARIKAMQLSARPSSDADHEVEGLEQGEDSMELLEAGRG